MLGRVRLSRFTEESTSVERQREAIESWAKIHGHVIVGWAVDVDFSRSIRPFDAPELGPWLNEPAKAAQWDILVAKRLDRLGAGLKLAPLYSWCLENDKDIICTTQPFNLRTPEGRIIANVLAEIAQGEWEATQERVLDSRQKLRELGRWPGGQPPYGYVPVKTEDGWLLEQDPHAVEVIRGMIALLSAGASLAGITAGLTERGELAPREYFRSLNGKPTEGKAWGAATVQNVLTSKALVGEVEHQGVTVRGENAQPVSPIRNPILTLSEYQDVVSKVELRKFKRTRTARTAPLSGVSKCAECGGNLHGDHQNVKGREYRYYRCRNRCGQSIPADLLEEMAEREFLEQLGAVEVHEPVFVPAEDHTAELEAAEKAVDELVKLMGSAESDRVRARLSRQLSALDDQIAELEKLPQRPASIEYRPVGRTYGAMWEEAASSPEDRRSLLINSGIEIDAKMLGRSRSGSGGVFEFAIRVPEDIRERMSKA